ncbi:hypothetical protein L7F22_053709 [Adiantum nelumboides]|nr:hypothetical protein [Adiantum nelumboides]
MSDFLVLIPDLAYEIDAFAEEVVSCAMIDIGIVHSGALQTARQWDKAPYEVDELSTNGKSHISDEVLAQIPAHIFIAKFRDEEGDNIKTTIMPREIWTLHRKPEVASAVRAVQLEQFFRLSPWGTDYMRAHELMSSIQYDGKAMLIDSDGAKVEVLITKEIINEALQFLPRAYDLIPKTKAIDYEKTFLKVKGSKFKYSDLIYSELELPLRLISQHLRVQKPPRYIEPFLHMAVVMALCVAERRQVRCDYAKFILESLIKANLKNSAKNKLYMNAGHMLTRVAYQALDMMDDLPAASSQAALIQQAKYVLKAVRTTSSAASSRSTRLKKSSSEEERTETDKEQDSQESAQEYIPKEVEAAGPSEYKRSDEEDTSTPLEKKSQKPRSREQVPMDKAMARVEARRKELADARAAKAAKSTRPMTMEEARKIRIEKAKDIQKERRRIEANKKAQEEAEAAQAARTQEKEVIDLSGTVEKAEEPVLEPTQGSPKRPRQEEEEDIEHIQADPIPPSPISIPPAPPSSPITPFPPASTPQTPPFPSPFDIPKSPPAPTSPQQQPFSAEPFEIPTSLPEETAQPMDKTEEEKQTNGEQHQPTDVDVPILIIQEDEPTNEEAIQEVKSFDYTRLIQTLSRQFKCQQVVAKETDIQKDRANKAQGHDDNGDEATGDDNDEVTIDDDRGGDDGGGEEDDGSRGDKLGAACMDGGDEDDALIGGGCINGNNVGDRGNRKGGGGTEYVLCVDDGQKNEEGSRDGKYGGNEIGSSLCRDDVDSKGGTNFGGGRDTPKL